MQPLIALQLHTIREALNRDFRTAVERVAQMGYIGVETAGFPGIMPKEAKQLFHDLGLQVAGAHLPLPLGEKQGEIIETINALGNPPLIIPYQPPEMFETIEGLHKLADLLNQANAIAKTHGFRLGYHNHHAEMHPIEGKPALLKLAQLTDPDIFFEIDTYWVQTGGVDPAGVLMELAERAPLLHIKDGPCVRGEPMVAVGEGVMNFDRIFAASSNYVQWAIVELDSCATDMMTAVEKSYQYLVQRKFVRGAR